MAIYCVVPLSTYIAASTIPCLRFSLRNCDLFPSLHPPMIPLIFPTHLLICIAFSCNTCSARYVRQRGERCRKTGGRGTLWYSRASFSTPACTILPYRSQVTIQGWRGQVEKDQAVWVLLQLGQAFRELPATSMNQQSSASSPQQGLHQESSLQP